MELSVLILIGNQVQQKSIKERNEKAVRTMKFSFLAIFLDVQCHDGQLVLRSSDNGSVSSGYIYPHRRGAGQQGRPRNPKVALHMLSPPHPTLPTTNLSDHRIRDVAKEFTYAFPTRKYVQKFTSS